MPAAATEDIACPTSRQGVMEIAVADLSALAPVPVPSMDYAANEATTVIISIKAYSTVVRPD